MYETVRIIKGHRVYRMTGTHSHYYVDLAKGQRCTFKSIKAAVQFIEQTF